MSLEATVSVWRNDEGYHAVCDMGVFRGETIWEALRSAASAYHIAAEVSREAVAGRGDTP